MSKRLHSESRLVTSTRRLEFRFSIGSVLKITDYRVAANENALTSRRDGFFSFRRRTSADVACGA